MSSIRSEIADREMMVVVKTHHFADVRILQCAGRITCGCADTFRIAVLRQPRVPLVVLDFAAVSRIDAAGLGILVSLHTWARETARNIKFMNLTATVEELFQITHLNSVFEFCSVPQILDLFCSPLESPRFGAEPAIQLIA
jgi:anti-anti-sigma factor